MKNIVSSMLLKHISDAMNGGLIENEIGNDCVKRNATEQWTRHIGHLACEAALDEGVEAKKIFCPEGRYDMAGSPIPVAGLEFFLPDKLHICVKHLRCQLICIKGH
jgi:hypothetical protein